MTSSRDGDAPPARTADGLRTAWLAATLAAVSLAAPARGTPPSDAAVVDGPERGCPAAAPGAARARGAVDRAGAGELPADTARADTAETDTGGAGGRASLPGLLRRPWQAWARDAIALAALHTLDRPVRSGAHDLADGAAEASAVDRVADRAEWFGDWESSLPWLVGGSLAVGQLTGGTRGLEEGAALVAGAAAASMANEAVNRAVGRGRPSWGEGALSLRPFRGHSSFPSGHTAYAFGFAAGIDAVTEGWAPAAAAYGVAGMTGLSRIYHDRHWFTDVVAGAVLSTAVSHLATRRALRLIRGGGEEGGPAGPGDRAGPDAAPRDGSGGGPRFVPLVTPRVLGVTVRF